jgi:hypothetical protein
VGSCPETIGADNRFLFAVDALHPNDNTESLGLGAEWSGGNGISAVIRVSSRGRRSRSHARRRNPPDRNGSSSTDYSGASRPPDSTHRLTP